MNLYLCTTIRHILFALTKALNEPSCNHELLISGNQQGISDTFFDLSVLPININLTFSDSKHIKKTLRKTLTGKLTYLASQLKVSTNKWLRNRVSKLILQDELNLDFNLNDDKLYLFNDRNSFARCLRLAFGQYECIEDGLASYTYTPLKFHEKITRKILGSKIKQRYFGDDPRCKCIYFLNPEKAPQELKFKAKAIDWIDFKSVQEICFPFFRLDPFITANIQPYIIATQPVSHAGLVDSGIDLKIYQMIIDELKNRDITPSFKIHPREPIEKFKQFKDQGLIMLPSKIPLELLLLSQKEKIKIYSIYSSSGMGFEKYCERHTLIEDKDADKQGEIIRSWIDDLSIVRNIIEGIA